MTRTPLALTALLAALAAALPSTASAAPVLNGTFPTSGKPRYLTRGADGNVWFTMSDSTKEFGRITPNGTVTEYDSPNDMNGANGIAPGPNNTIWIAENTEVVRVPIANPNAGQSFDVPLLTDPKGLAYGPDKHIWAASNDDVIEIDPANGAVIDDYTVMGMSARGVARSSGFIWVADFGGKRVIKVSPAGATTPFDVPVQPQEVAGGPNQIAIAMPNSLFGRMGLNGPPVLTTSMPATDPFGIVFGPDGAYWTAQFGSHSIGRVTPSGGYTTLNMPAGSGPRHITNGLNNTLFVGLETAKRIARVTGVVRPVTPPPPDTTKPVITRLRAKPRTLRVFGPRRRRGTRFRFNSTEAGRAVLRIQRARRGRRLASGKCVKPTQAPRRARRCTRWGRVGTLRRNAKAGRNSIRFAGRVRGKLLQRGRYRVVVTVRDAAGNRSAPRRTRFRVPRQRRPRRT